MHLKAVKVQMLGRHNIVSEISNFLGGGQQFNFVRQKFFRYVDLKKIRHSNRKCSTVSTSPRLQRLVK